MGNESAGFSGRISGLTVRPGRLRERLRFRTDFVVHRWDEEQTIWAHERLGLPGHVTLTPAHFAAVGVKPYSVTADEDCNLITLAGETAVLGGICSGGTAMTNKFSASFARIGVGTGTSAPSSADTHLTGDTGSSSTTSYYQLAAVAPVVTAGSASPATLAFSASFGGSVANFAWQEFGCDNYTTSGVTTQGLGASVIFFNHGLSSQGTKVSGQTWSPNVVMSFGNTGSVS